MNSVETGGLGPPLNTFTPSALERGGPAIPVHWTNMHYLGWNDSRMTKKSSSYNETVWKINTLRCLSDSVTFQIKTVLCNTEDKDLSSDFIIFFSIIFKSAQRYTCLLACSSSQHRSLVVASVYLKHFPLQFGFKMKSLVAALTFCVKYFKKRTSAA